jgi:putative exosortase-associated protein (TIGR04073 family)
LGTNSRVWSKAVAVVLILALLAMSAPVAAQVYYDPLLDVPRPTGLQLALTKLGRGFSNIMLGWAEVPVAFDRGVKRGRPLGYLLGVAPVLGAARALMRTSAGVFEVVTFPFSDQTVNYRPVLEQEFIF